MYVVAGGNADFGGISRGYVWRNVGKWVLPLKNSQKLPFWTSCDSGKVVKHMETGQDDGGRMLDLRGASPWVHGFRSQFVETNDARMFVWSSL
jgi:hypothetical protein